MENQSPPSFQKQPGLKSILPTIFSAISVAMTLWIAYQNTQVQPKIDEISDQVQQIRGQVEQTGGGVATLQQMDEARKMELFRQLTENRNNQEDVLRAFQEVFPEDEFWFNEELGQPRINTAP
ncbi:hypothetical protein C8255_03575 [filamentous cyanobacterium CCP3]|nr:hypothetical protein C8255_03575 [filamentous cyanobacterium CCP3]